MDEDRRTLLYDKIVARLNESLYQDGNELSDQQLMDIYDYCLDEAETLDVVFEINRMKERGIL